MGKFFFFINNKFSYIREIIIEITCNKYSIIKYFIYVIPYYSVQKGKSKDKYYLSRQYCTLLNKNKSSNIHNILLQ